MNPTLTPFRLPRVTAPTKSVEATSLLVPSDRRDMISEIASILNSGETFVTLRGAAGTGKSTMLELLDEALASRGFRTIRMASPSCKPTDLQGLIGQIFDVADAGTMDPVHLVAASETSAKTGRTCLVLLDDADRCNESLIHYISLVCTLYNRERRSLRIVMAGALGFWECFRPPYLQPFRRSGVGVMIPPFTIDYSREFCETLFREAGTSSRRVCGRRAFAEMLESAEGRPAELIRLARELLAGRAARIGGAGSQVVSSRRPGPRGWSYLAGGAFAVAAVAATFVAWNDDYKLPPAMFGGPRADLQAPRGQPARPLETARLEPAQVASPALVPAIGTPVAIHPSREEPTAVRVAPPSAASASREELAGVEPAPTAIGAAPAPALLGAPAAAPALPSLAIVSPALPSPAPIAVAASERVVSRSDAGTQPAAGTPEPAAEAVASPTPDILASREQMVLNGAEDAPSVGGQLDVALAEPVVPTIGSPAPRSAGKTDLDVARPSGAPMTTASIPDSERAPGGGVHQRGGRGLLLVVRPGDTMLSLYSRIYQGTTPPPFAEVLAANPAQVKPGSTVIFPAPAEGWSLH